MSVCESGCPVSMSVGELYVCKWECFSVYECVCLRVSV